jgi:hypothetical protein
VERAVLGRAVLGMTDISCQSIDAKNGLKGRGGGPEVGISRAEGDLRSVYNVIDLWTLAIAPLRY